jgi:hypothetical protein
MKSTHRSHLPVRRTYGIFRVTCHFDMQTMPDSGSPAEYLECQTVCSEYSYWGTSMEYVWKLHAKSGERSSPATVPTNNRSVDRLLFHLVLEGRTYLTYSLTVPVGNFKCLRNKARWNKHTSNTLEVLPSSNIALLFMHYLMRIYFHSFSKRALNICNSEHSLLQIV